MAWNKSICTKCGGPRENPEISRCKPCYNTHKREYNAERRKIPALMEWRREYNRKYQQTRRAAKVAA